MIEDVFWFLISLHVIIKKIRYIGTNTVNAHGRRSQSVYVLHNNTREALLLGSRRNDVCNLSSSFVHVPSKQEVRALFVVGAPV